MVESCKNLEIKNSKSEATKIEIFLAEGDGIGEVIGNDHKKVFVFFFLQQ